MTGRIVVGIACVITLAGAPWMLPFLLMSPLAVAGLYAAALKPDLFE